MYFLSLYHRDICLNYNRIAGIIDVRGQCTRLMRELIAVTHFDIVITFKQAMYKHRLVQIFTATSQYIETILLHISLNI